MDKTSAPTFAQCLVTLLVRPLVGLSVALHLLAIAALLLHPGHWLAIVLILLGNHLLLVALSLWPRSRWLDPNMTHLPEAATRLGYIALTIDDGPDPEVTPKVLDILDKSGAKVTFFCVGELVERYPDLAREIIRRGHAIENHSMQHRWSFSLMGLGGLGREVALAQDALSAVRGSRPRFFRAPAGLRNPLLGWVLLRQQLRLVSWTRRGFDTVNAQPGTILQRLTRGLRAGDILLLHDGHAARTPDGTPVILAVLPDLLEQFGAAGLSPVTLATAVQ